MSNPNGDWPSVVTHALTALIGGGLASLAQAITSHKRLSIDQAEMLLDAMRHERDTLRGLCEQRSQELEEYRQALYDMRQGCLILMKQLHNADCEPLWTLEEFDTPEGDDPVHRH